MSSVRIRSLAPVFPDTFKVDRSALASEVSSRVTAAVSAGYRAKGPVTDGKGSRFRAADRFLSGLADGPGTPWDRLTLMALGCITALPDGQSRRRCRRSPRRGALVLEQQGVPRERLVASSVCSARNISATPMVPSLGSTGGGCWSSPHWVTSVASPYGRSSRSPAAKSSDNTAVRTQGHTRRPITSFMGSTASTVSRSPPASPRSL
jgi:hypothetical protein